MKVYRDALLKMDVTGWGVVPKHIYACCTYEQILETLKCDSKARDMMPGKCIK